jgi:hypothetical protein
MLPTTVSGVSNIAHPFHRCDGASPPVMTAIHLDAADNQQTRRGGLAGSGDAHATVEKRDGARRLSLTGAQCVGR